MIDVKQKELDGIYKEQDEWKSEVVEEVGSLKEELRKVSAQKGELIVAIEDLSSIFNSFSLKL